MNHLTVWFPITLLALPVSERASEPTFLCVFLTYSVFFVYRVILRSDRLLYAYCLALSSRNSLYLAYSSVYLHAFVRENLFFSYFLGMRSLVDAVVTIATVFLL